MSAQRRSSIAVLITRTGDEEALEELARRREEALPAVLRALRRSGDWSRIDAAWHCAILARVSAAPAEHAVLALRTVPYPLAGDLAFLLRQSAAAAHLPFLREQLAKLVPGVRPRGSGRFPASFGWHHAMPAAAAVAEALGRLGDRPSEPALRALLDAGLREIAALREKGGSFYEMFYRDYAPAAAAAAAALLALAEKGAPIAEAELERCREAALRFAQDPAIDYGYEAVTPPMPFLFVDAPREAMRLLIQLLREAGDQDRALRHAAAWLTEAREHGVAVPLDTTDEGAAALIEEIASAIGDAAGWGAPAHDPAWAPMEVARAISPPAAIAGAMRLLAESRMGAEALVEAHEALRAALPFPAIAAIAVEAVLANRANRNHFATLQQEDEEQLNAALRRAGLAQVVGWAWRSPPGAWHALAGLDAPEALDETLRAVAAATSGGAPPQDGQAARLHALRPHSLVRHAIYRTLLVALAAAGDRDPGPWLALWPRPEDEEDPGMVGAILRMAGDLRGSGRVGAALPLLLASPAVRESESLAIRLIRSLPRTPSPDHLARLRAFRAAVGIDAGAGRDAGSWATSELARAVEEAEPALGAVVTRDAILEVLTGRAPVSDEYKLTLLRLAAQNISPLDPDIFDRLFGDVIAGSSSVYAGWTGAITGDRAREFLVRRLSDPFATREQVIAAADYCFWARNDGLPPEALRPVLAFLGFAVEEAESRPGEEWEDRNWGGYRSTPAEDLAHSLSTAALCLAEATYTAAGWRALINGLRALLATHAIDLAHLRITRLTSTSCATTTVDLLAVLRANVARLGDPALEDELARLKV